MFNTYCSSSVFFFFFFNDTATTEIYTLSLHDALPIWSWRSGACGCFPPPAAPRRRRPASTTGLRRCRDRKSTRLNSSHGYISYAVFCLKKKKKKKNKNNTTYVYTNKSTQYDSTIIYKL